MSWGGANSIRVLEVTGQAFAYVTNSFGRGWLVSNRRKREVNGIGPLLLHTIK